MNLIYCADGNRRFAEIAIRHGYRYGAQLPNTVYFTPYFTDQNWRNPNRRGYMAALARYRPALATVLDWERMEQLYEVLGWAEEAAQYVTDSVIIIPKVPGGISRLPRMINGKHVRLGYSASSTFSSTPVPLTDFRGWPVHCLGGSVARQMQFARMVDVESADGNYIQRIAREWCQVYSPSGPGSKHKGYTRLMQFCGYVGKDAPYIAFELNCIGASMAWKGHSGQDIYEAQIAHLDSVGLKPKHKQLPLFEVTS